MPANAFKARRDKNVNYKSGYFAAIHYINKVSRIESRFGGRTKKQQI